MKEEKDLSTAETGAVNKTENIVNSVNNEFDFSGDAFEHERERAEQNLAVERIENTRVFSTNVPLIKFDTAGKDGEIYSNYRVGWKYSLNGTLIEYKIDFIPTDRRRVLYDTLKAMFGSDSKIPLQIVRTEYERNNQKTVTYSARVSVVSPDGMEIVLPLRPSGVADRTCFDILVNYLKKVGQVS